MEQIYVAVPVIDGLAAGHFGVQKVDDSRIIGIDLRMDETRARGLAQELNKAYMAGMYECQPRG